MIIKFSEIKDYRINGKDHDYKVEKRYVQGEKLRSGEPNPDAGKDRWVAETFHPTVEQACRAILKDMVMTTEGEKEIHTFMEWTRKQTLILDEAFTKN